MDLPNPFFQVVRKGATDVMQVNADEISTVEATPTGTTLIVMHNGDRIETGTSMREIELAISDARAKD